MILDNQIPSKKSARIDDAEEKKSKSKTVKPVPALKSKLNSDWAKSGASKTVKPVRPAPKSNTSGVSNPGVSKKAMKKKQTVSEQVSKEVKAPVLVESEKGKPDHWDFDNDEISVHPSKRIIPSSQSSDFSSSYTGTTDVFFSGISMTEDSSLSTPQPALSLKYDKRYVIEREIGSGGFGKVYQAVDSKSGRSVALKKVICNTIQSLNSAMEEFKSVLSLKHENVASYFDSYLDETTALNQFVLCIIMPLYAGDLSRLLDARREAKRYLSTLEVIHLGIDIATGLQYLHEKLLIHRDLKPANIFICPIQPLESPIAQVPATELQFKIGDFGLVKNVEDSFAETTAGTQIYMAPELFDNRPYHHTADIWSFGCVLLEICKLSLEKKLQYMQLLLKGEESYHKGIEQELLQLEYPAELIAVVVDCLKKDASQRCSAAQIIVRLNDIKTKL